MIYPYDLFFTYFLFIFLFTLVCLPLFIYLCRDLPPLFIPMRFYRSLWWRIPVLLWLTVPCLLSGSASGLPPTCVSKCSYLFPPFCFPLV